MTASRRSTATSPIPARVRDALPRAPWTERRADSFDHSDLYGLSRIQLWAEKRRAEDALYYLVSRGRDGFVWAPYLGSPGSATAWLQHRVDACSAALRGGQNG
jgi:hypothetical protein